ncbi:MAG: universal stress protein [Candidatus Heimdallarchaeota archaeon]|nr:universal stress protein [Candidatus Heimdallarchaeota archaeon]MCK4253905.1 universal stress protein [Candidatus Heimdallarchaeota archaeon]
MFTIRKALVAISDFESGISLIKQLIDFFDDWVTEIHLINVIDSETVQHLANFRGETNEDIENKCKTESENILQKLINVYSDSHLFITYSIETGIVSDAIIEASLKEEVDFITMGTKRERIAKRLLRNHIRYVIELASIPVLLYPV